MFCPRCQSEYRPGFERCADCDVPLVDDLAAAAETTAARAPATEPAVRPARGCGTLVDSCGFLDLDEAREARARLRSRGIPSEIVIRDAPGHPDTAPNPAEEYWMRFDAAHLRAASALLGYDAAPPDGADAETVPCHACGTPHAAEEVFCSHCGARFDR